MEKRYTCCVFGHRTITETEELNQGLYDLVENLILKEKVDTFLFGSKSRFNDCCLEAVTKIKEKYPHIKRVYVRAEYPYIDKKYKTYLSGKFEDSYFPEKILSSGKAVYLERNFEMIDKSKFCIVYYDEKHLPKTRKSGTAIALDYAVKQKKQIFILPAGTEGALSEE